MIRLLVLYPSADPEGYGRVQHAARSLRTVPGVRALEVSRAGEPFGASEERGPVIAAGFDDVEAMRRAMASDAWAGVTGALPNGTPAVRAYVVRQMLPWSDARAPLASTDVDVGEELSAEPEPDEPISTQLDFPSAHRHEEEEGP